MYFRNSLFFCLSPEYIMYNHLCHFLLKSCLFFLYHLYRALIYHNNLSNTLLFSYNQMDNMISQLSLCNFLIFQNILSRLLHFLFQNKNYMSSRFSCSYTCQNCSNLLVYLPSKSFLLIHSIYHTNRKIIYQKGLKYRFL